ncbi:hypothetical protein XENOCAPTIV_030755 [Xenoophorus captivus]|uniref:Uncharacterized protein n=1 Tax=Xenoophorus captivus TaxID=1517983 RepID=A0ABV0QDB1_9TELE
MLALRIKSASEVSPYCSFKNNTGLFTACEPCNWLVKHKPCITTTSLQLAPLRVSGQVAKTTSLSDSGALQRQVDFYPPRCITSFSTNMETTKRHIYLSLKCM